MEMTQEARIERDQKLMEPVETPVSNPQWRFSTDEATRKVTQDQNYSRSENTASSGHYPAVRDTYVGQGNKTSSYAAPHGIPKSARNGGTTNIGFSDLGLDPVQVNLARVLLNEHADLGARRAALATLQASHMHSAGVQTVVRHFKSMEDHSLQEPAVIPPRVNR